MAWPDSTAYYQHARGRPDRLGPRGGRADVPVRDELDARADGMSFGINGMGADQTIRRIAACKPSKPAIARS